MALENYCFTMVCIIFENRQQCWFLWSAIQVFKEKYRSSRAQYLDHSYFFYMSMI